MELVHGTMELGLIANAVFTLMRRFLVYMVTHGASPRYMNVTRLRGFPNPRSRTLRLQERIWRGFGEDFGEDLERMLERMLERIL